MPSPRFDQETIERLKSIGFKSRDDVTLLLPDGQPISGMATVEFDKMGGRVSNIGYMARAMDHYDGVTSPADGTPQGDRQFEHLLSRFPTSAMVYFALRRRQRNGDLAGLRTGLALLLAFEQDLITPHDILAALWPDGHTQAAQKLMLPPTSVAIGA